MLTFLSIAELTSCAKDTYVDVMGVCKSVGDLTNLVSRAGKDFIAKIL